MEDSNSNNKDKNKDKYKYVRPDVSEGESSVRGSGENEKDRAAIDGPYRGVQSARGLEPTAGETNQPEVNHESSPALHQSLTPKRRGRKGTARPTQSMFLNPCRILITQEASQSLDDMAAKVSSGFEGGRIGRPQIVSWILQQFALRMTDSDIEKIRSAYFDRVAYLESLLKRAKETGIAPPELDALFEGKGVGSAGKKRTA